MLFKKKKTESLDCYDEEARKAEMEEEVKEWNIILPERRNNFYEVAYKVKVVGNDNKVKTITKKVTIEAKDATEAISKFTNGSEYEKGQVVEYRRISMKELRK